jgi:deoxycytidine triphosphate deaminase
MSIKADRWIRKMALEHGMIEPFVERQMREGVISYGLSSYGYDVRVADEYKVFSNVYNVVVDPKNFSPRSFVDIQAEFCDIPPNSFALARSVERFRIPRKVSCIVMGKSSYARCFAGQTRVALADGTAPTLEEMAQRSEHGELFWGYSIGQHGRLIVTLLEAPRYIGRDSLVEVTLDDGASVQATPDHEFMLRDGRMRVASELRPGDSLMPLYRQLARGYEMVYQPLNGRFTTPQKQAAKPVLIPSNGPHMAFQHAASLHTAGRVAMLNHKVVAIRDIAGTHDVFCLTVPEAGNFALDAGIFVSNCGVIVNVTPLEPEWEGFVTIEISNTTPLPARIYSNEGIGQVIFLESDEECETSYADKRGKYMGQVGIVLPKVER